MRKKLHQYRDKKRYQDYQTYRAELKEWQEDQSRGLQHGHDMQALDLGRKVRALDQVEKREIKSLEESLRKEQRVQARGGRDQMPSLALELKPMGRRAVPHKAKNRFRNRLSGEMQKATTPKEIDLEDEFSRAASGEQGEGKAGTGEGPQPKTRSKVDEYRRQKARKRDRDKDRGR